ncbi:MAG: hypothetical protein RLY85_2313 [Bacteroidota bacterium]
MSISNHAFKKKLPILIRRGAFSFLMLTYNLWLFTLRLSPTFGWEACHMFLIPFPSSLFLTRSQCLLDNIPVLDGILVVWINLNDLIEESRRTSQVFFHIG